MAKRELIALREQMGDESFRAVLQDVLADVPTSGAHATFPKAKRENIGGAPRKTDADRVGLVLAYAAITGANVALAARQMVQSEKPRALPGAIAKEARPLAQAARDYQKKSARQERKLFAVIVDLTQRMNRLLAKRAQEKS